MLYFSLPNPYVHGVGLVKTSDSAIESYILQ